MPDSSLRTEQQEAARIRDTIPGRELKTEEIRNHVAYFHNIHPALNLHVISLKVDDKWDRTSRMNTDPQWLAELEKMGYQDAEEWLKKNARHLGRKSTYETPVSGQNPGYIPNPS